MPYLSIEEWQAIKSRVNELGALDMTPWDVARILDWVIISIMKDDKD